MKLAKINVSLEFETDSDDVDFIREYLSDLNDYLAEVYGRPQIVDIETLSEEDCTFNVIEDFSDREVFSSYYDNSLSDEEDTEDEF